MGLFPWSSDNTTSALDIVEKTGDALFFTDEEKAAGRIKRQEIYLKLQEIVARQNTVMAKTRRMFALSTLWVFLGCVVASGAFAGLGEMDIAKALLDLAGVLVWLVAMFAAFYVGPDAVASGAEVAKNFKGVKK
jgi:hypothetical protein